ncbi:MAG: DUF3769 domain-containing protein [Vulcanococcus sp. Clear-D1]|nr:DUF3769 domain-containing protein [Vulcanococcus sp. Clear-D1]
MIAVLGSASVLIGGHAVAAEQQPSPAAPAASDQPARPSSAAGLIEATPAQKPPIDIDLSADSQGFDLLANRFVAVGNVKVILAGGRLLADRIEYESATRTIYASGRVRFQRGNQYLQASKLRYSLIENSGEIDEVYGVVDLDSAALDLNPSETPAAPLLPLSYWSASAPPFDADVSFDAEPLPDPDARVADELSATPLNGESAALNLPSGLPEAIPADAWQMPPVALSPQAQTMACPPPLPPVPNWRPYPWAATVWGGQMISANFGDTFLFNGRMRPEYLWGAGLNKRLLRAGPLALEFDSNALLHHAYEQQGGEFNQKVPYANTPAQTFGEFTWSFGVRAWLQPWLSLAFFEGVSLNTNVSNYEKTFRENYTTFLNYLGFEVEALIRPEWSLVGRIHHRSGAYGTYSGVSEGSNAYLVGMRYRFGSSPSPRFSVAMQPPAGCPGGGQPQSKPLSDQLNQVALGSAQQATGTPLDVPNAGSRSSALSPGRQEALRHKAIAAAVDQRVSDLQFQQSLSVERRAGVDPDADLITEAEVTYGQVRPQQLQPLNTEIGNKFVSGTISRWRIQANRLSVTPDGWRADRAAFTNDPYTPAQSWVDASGVVARQEPNGDLVIQAKSNQLILEDRLPIALQRNQRFEKDREVENRWVMAVDSEDRDGFYLGYNLKPLEVGKRGTLNLQPQFMVRRALDGTTSSYVLPGLPIGSSPQSQPTRIGDLFGLLARFDTRVLGLKIDVVGDFSTFDPSNFANGTRSWGDISRSFRLPVIGRTTARGFGAYRYRVWNGSLGEQDVYSALGASLEQTRDLPNLGKLTNTMFWRAGFGNFQGTEFNSVNLADLWRANVYGSINSRLPLWTGKPLNPETELATRFSSTPIVPGLAINTNLNMNLAYYGDGTSQQAFSISGGPTLTLGHLQNNFFDYTQFTVTGGGTLRQGVSPFSFDRIVDLSTIGLGLTQQLVGPLMLSGGIGVNTDPNSEFFGDVVDSYVELRWQRRAYELAVYYSPYQGIGGVRVKLNDFNFRGTGVPFVPYTPPGLAQDQAIQRRGF